MRYDDINLPEICGTCKHWQRQNEDGVHVCVNYASIWCTEWREMQDTCREWDGRALGEEEYDW